MASPVATEWEVLKMDCKEKAGSQKRVIEKKIGGVTYVVSVEQGQNAREPLKEKLKKIILETARSEKNDLSE